MRGVDNKWGDWEKALPPIIFDLFSEQSKYTRSLRLIVQPIYINSGPSRDTPAALQCYSDYLKVR